MVKKGGTYIIHQKSFSSEAKMQNVEKHIHVLFYHQTMNLRSINYSISRSHRVWSNFMHGMPSGSNPFLGGERHKMKNVAQNIDPGVLVVVVV